MKLVEYVNRVEKGFEPLKYLENVAKENLERTKKKN